MKSSRVRCWFCRMFWRDSAGVLTRKSFAGGGADGAGPGSSFSLSLFYSFILFFSFTHNFGIEGKKNFYKWFLPKSILYTVYSNGFITLYTPLQHVAMMCLSGLIHVCWDSFSQFLVFHAYQHIYALPVLC